MASYTSDSVLVAEAAILYAPTGTALPDETSVAWNTFGSWTGWTMLGYTTQPTTFTYAYDTLQVDVQQSLAPIKQRKINESVVLASALAQFEGALLALVLSGTNVTTAAGAGQKGFDRVTTGGDPALTERMFAIEGWRQDSAGTKQPVRCFIYRGTITANGAVPFNKSAVTEIPITITGLGDSTKAIGANLLEWQIVTAPATA
jgi:hypothetical protein